MSSEQARRELEQTGPNAMPDTSAHPLRTAVGKFWAPVPWMLEAAVALELMLGKFLEAAIIAVLLPYAAESFALRVRGRATGWVAGCTKMGGLIAQALSIAALVPPLTIAAGAILAPVGLSLVMTAVFGAETRGRDLRELDRAAIGAASNSRPGRLAQEIEPGG